MSSTKSKSELAPPPTFELRRALKCTLQVRKADVLIRVRAQPGARREVIVGLHGDLHRVSTDKTSPSTLEIKIEIKIKTLAPPVDGEANIALQRLLSEVLGVATSRVQLIRGQTSRSKIFSIAPERGCTTPELSEKIVETLFRELSRSDAQGE
ncbi:MAG TPA: DUF167 domain-containing protein [Pseudobdellovibrionaceae bacterium]|nr:DUF167 domain-containing protein [Pseudobdellovibrionaceae bacterium]